MTTTKQDLLRAIDFSLLQTLPDRPFQVSGNKSQIKIIPDQLQGILSLQSIAAASNGTVTELGKGVLEYQKYLPGVALDSFEVILKSDTGVTLRKLITIN